MKIHKAKLRYLQLYVPCVVEFCVFDCLLLNITILTIRLATVNPSYNYDNKHEEEKRIRVKFTTIPIGRRTIVRIIASTIAILSSTAASTTSTALAIRQTNHAS